MNKKGNVVAVILIIAAMVAGATLILNAQYFGSESDIFQRAMNDFSQFVYSDVNEIVEEYAQNGYSKNDDLWFCADYPSPPNITKVYDDFPEFADALLSGRLDSLSELFPNYEIQMSDPTFQLMGEMVQGNAIDNVVSVNVSDFTVIIEDGERLIGSNYSTQQDLAYRYWYMYKVMKEWLSCRQGSIFAEVESSLEGRSCAFYKDQCFCAADPDSYTVCEPGDIPGIDCNDCPCGMDGHPDGLPVFDDPDRGEDCSLDDPMRCQDFTSGERRDIINEYGLTPSEVIDMADRIAEKLNQAFRDDYAGSVCEERLDQVVTGPTDITCQAEVSNVIVENEMFSSLVYHPSACGEQVDGTCGWIPLDQMNSLLCAGAPFCPDRGDDQESVIANLDLRAEYLTDLPSTSDNCEVWDELEVTNHATNITQILYNQTVCEYMGRYIIVGEIAIDDVEGFDCRLSATLFTANRGGVGAYVNETFVGALACNPLPEGADGSPGDIASNYVVGVTAAGSNTIADHWDPSLGQWYGVNGWIDRRAGSDVTIRCQDPGDGTVEPFETAIKLKVVFRHGCDVTQRQYRAWAPPVCGAAPEANTPGCDANCPQRPCMRVQCVEGGENGPDTCEYTPDVGAACGGSANSCQRGTCVENVDNPDRPVCDMETPYYEPAGTSCGTCRSCDGAGVCDPERENEQQCFVQGQSICAQAACNSGACELSPRFEEVEPGQCGRGPCGECECSGTEEVWVANPNPECPEPQDVYECQGATSGTVVGQVTYSCTDAQGQCQPSTTGGSPVPCCGNTPTSECGWCCAEGTPSETCVAGQEFCSD